MSTALQAGRDGQPAEPEPTAAARVEPVHVRLGPEESTLLDRVLIADFLFEWAAALTPARSPRAQKRLFERRLHFEARPQRVARSFAGPGGGERRARLHSSQRTQKGAASGGCFLPLIHSTAPQSIFRHFSHAMSTPAPSLPARFTTFAVAGGSGFLGRAIVDGLVAAPGGRRVLVLSRSSETKVPEGAEVAGVDFDSRESVTKALEGIEVVISCLRDTQATQQPILAEAAK
jgi:hypothetical protein